MARFNLRYASIYPYKITILNKATIMKKILLTITTLILCFSINSHAAETKGKVLVIMSSADQLRLKDKKTAETGFYLNEFAIPVKEIMDAGYEIIVATPSGKKPVMDKDSKNPMFFQDDKKKMDDAAKLADKILTNKNVRKLSEVADGKLNEYAGVFIPGGHAPMVDLIVDPSVGKILTYFHENAKPTAMICHGPIASISVMENPAGFRSKLIQGNKSAAEQLANGWLYKDYEMTIFSNDEEKKAEKDKLHGQMQFHPEDALKLAGAKLKIGAANENNVVEDRELITGQNPASDNETAKALINAMDKKTAK